jgi:hypothetical protein
MLESRIRAGTGQAVSGPAESRTRRKIQRIQPAWGCQSRKPGSCCRAWRKLRIAANRALTQLRIVCGRCQAAILRLAHPHAAPAKLHRVAATRLDPISWTPRGQRRGDPGARVPGGRHLAVNAISARPATLDPELPWPHRLRNGSWCSLNEPVSVSAKLAAGQGEWSDE